MAGHKNWRVLLKDFTADEMAELNALVDRDVAEIELANLRKTQNVTQAQLAKRLGISQSALSQTEGQSDMQISTLRKLIEALGGNLEITVQLPNERYRLVI